MEALEQRSEEATQNRLLEDIRRGDGDSFHAWYNSAQQLKRAKDDMELTNRCIHRM
jgi:hypothetical protein